MRCIPRTSDDQFLVLACDGVWDVMTSQAAAEYIGQSVLESDFVATSDKLTMVGYDLLLECLKRGSEDNMTVLIIPANADAIRATKSMDGKEVKASKVRRQLWLQSNDV